MSRRHQSQLLPFALVALSACGPAGVEWVRADSGTTQRLWAIHGSAANDVWAVGEFGTAVHWDGSTWRAVDTGSSGDLVAIWAVSPTDAWAVGDKGLALHWDGVKWTRAEIGGDYDLHGVWASAPDDVWLGPSTGRESLSAYGALRFDGSAWRLSSFGTGDGWVAHVWGSSTSDVWMALQMDGLLMHWNGSTWREVDSEMGTLFDFDDLWGTRKDDVWAVGSTSTSERSLLHYDGTRWRRIAPDEALEASFSMSWEGVWSGGSNTWIVGGSGLVARWDGTTWTQELQADFTAPTLRDVWGPSETDVWAVGDDGVIVRRTPPTSQ